MSLGKMVLEALSDDIVFGVLQLFIAILLIIAVLNDLLKRLSSGPVVRRGRKSWNYLNLACGFALLIAVELTSLTDAFQGHKTIIVLFDIATITYLAFFNSWSRNKIVGFFAASETKEERH